MLKVLDILDSPEGVKKLAHLKKMTGKFENGLKELGFETIEGPHPVVPLKFQAQKCRHIDQNAHFHQACQTVFSPSYPADLLSLIFYYRLSVNFYRALFIN